MKFSLTIIFLFLIQQTYSQFFPPVTGAFDHTEKPTLLWKYKTNGPIVGAPVIDGDLVFTGSLDSTLYAIDLSTGKLRWKLPTGGAIRSSVCIMPQRLFLLSGDGVLYRMSKDSGRVDGFFQTMTGYMGDRQHDLADYYSSTPIIEDSTIYFGSGEYIYAISINDGFIKWTVKTGDVVHTKPAISKGWLYAGSYDGNLYAIDIKTGVVSWKFKTTGKYSFPKGEVMGNPVVAQGLVIAGARDYNLYAVDVRGGFCSWMTQFPFGWALPVTVNDSVVYVGTSDDRTLMALDIRSGREYWRKNVGFNIMGGVAMGTNIGYFGTLNGKLFGIDLRNGELGWEIELDSYRENKSKWLKDDGSYREDIGKLVRSHLDVMRMYGQLGGIFSTPATSGENIVVAGYDGWIYCFGAGTKK